MALYLALALAHGLIARVPNPSLLITMCMAVRHEVWQVWVFHRCNVIKSLGVNVCTGWLPPMRAKKQAREQLPILYQPFVQPARYAFASLTEITRGMLNTVTERFPQLKSKYCRKGKGQRSAHVWLMWQSYQKKPEMPPPTLQEFLVESFC